MFAAKYAVLIQIQRIFVHRDHWRSAFLVIHILIRANFLLYFSVMISFILACIPRAKIWNPTLDGVCIDTNTSILATSAINVVSNIAITVVLVMGVMKLQLPMRRKLGIAAIFATGIMSVTVSGRGNGTADWLRANVATIMHLYHSVRLTQTEDVTWAIEPVAAWA
jgi:energy-converting hydrogenase Eha subunit A